MNYLEQIQLFTEYVRTEYIPAGAQLLWYKLIQINNECGWKKKFRITNLRLQSEIDVKSEKTLIKHRQCLIDNHMILFKSGGKDEPSTYQLLEFYRDEDGIVKPGYNGENTPKTAVEASKTREDQTKSPEKPIEQEGLKERKKREFYDQIQALFNDHHRKMPTIRAMSDTRKKRIDRLLKKYAIEDIEAVILKSEKSDFLNGDNDRGWTASFDWITEPKNFLKILEDTYQNKMPKVKSVSADDYLTAVGSGVIDLDGTPVENLKTFQDYEIVSESIAVDQDIQEWMNS